LIFIFEVIWSKKINGDIKMMTSPTR